MTFGRGFMVHHSRPGRDRGNRRGRTRRPTGGRSEACPYRGSDGGHYRRGAPRGRPQAELYGGGEGGIRTHGPLARSRALQARLIGHSSTSPPSHGEPVEPWRPKALRESIFTQKASLQAGSLHAAGARLKPGLLGVTTSSEGHPSGWLIHLSCHRFSHVQHRIKFAISASLCQSVAGKLFRLVAEGVGFEPTVRLHAHRFSRAAPSTSRTPLPAYYSARSGLAGWEQWGAEKVAARPSTGSGRAVPRFRSW